MSKRKDVRSKKITHDRAERLLLPVSSVFLQAAGAGWKRGTGFRDVGKRGEAQSVNR